MSFHEFCLGIRREFPIISQTALHVLLPFGAVCLCEVVFSALIIMESKPLITLKLLKAFYDLQYQIFGKDFIFCFVSIIYLFLFYEY